MLAENSFISLIEEQLIAEAVREYLVDIAQQAQEAREDRAQSDEPEVKESALQILRILKFALLEELNTDVKEEDKIKTDKEFDSTIESLMTDSEMEGLRHLKTSIIGPFKRR
jgi:hypothetical protein